MKKKDKDALIEITNNRLSTSIGGGNKTLLKNEGSRSFSKTFIDFINPLIENDILDEDKTKAHLTWGLMVWNKAVAESYPNHRTSKNVEEIYPLFFGLNKNPLINEYLLRKHKLFRNDAFFIYSFEVQWDDKGNMAISVAAIQIENNL
ncbi:MAG TPA: hypothetical protein VIL78_02090 [Hanamia sp.]